MSTNRGMVIVLEGLDRVGKSTQAMKLAQTLQMEWQQPTELIRFPDRSTKIGNLISQYLKGETELNDHVIHLLFTANRWEKFDQMMKMIKSGTNIIIDRYSFSGVAYSAAKGLDLKWCKAPETGLIKPDCVIYLSSNDLDEIKKRANFGDEIYEQIEFQESVHNSYRQMTDYNWNVIDITNKNIEEVHQEILQIVKIHFKKLSDKINYLW